VESRCYASSIPAGGQVTFVYTARIRRRGAYNITNALISTRFPFGLFEKRILARHPSRIIVFPRLEEVAHDALPGSREAHMPVPQRLARRPGGDEFRALRDYRPGDDPRRIAWRVTAHRGTLVLKEMERENRGRVAVLLATNLAGVPATDQRSALEQSVTLAASLVRHFHRERRPMLFATAGMVRSNAASTEAYHAILAHLATIRADHRATPDAVLEEAGARRLVGLDVIVVTPGPARIASPPGCRVHPVSVLSAEAARLLRRAR
jgi:uncharacterized protein (DUF58 family)